MPKPVIWRAFFFAPLNSGAFLLSGRLKCGRRFFTDDLEDVTVQLTGASMKEGTRLELACESAHQSIRRWV